MPVDLSRLIAKLRSAGGDCTNVEVKSAAGGLPESLTSTLSALANHPGGGVIILGLDERNNFNPVPLSDPQILKQGLAKKARAFTPPIQLTIEDASTDGMHVIVAIVHECATSAKPCRASSTGAAYMRGYDGDFRMSPLEEQAFLAAREHPTFDRLPVTDATLNDLDPDLINEFTRTVRQQDRLGLGRFEGEELLRHAGVLTADDIPTRAGLLALGIYPQQWFPNFVIQAAAERLPTDPLSVRARNHVIVSGPIPRMLDGILDWAGRTFDSRISNRSDGHVVNVPAYPLVAFRELIVNAILHRDLDEWSMGMAVQVRLRSDRLVIGNPGGLYGITVDRLGQEAVTSARNQWLVRICQYLQSPGYGGRVVEGLATGMPMITQSLIEADLPPVRFDDAGIRFTAILRQPTRNRKVEHADFSRSATDTSSKAPVVRKSLAGDNQRPTTTREKIVEFLKDGPASVADLQKWLGLSAQGTRKALKNLRDEGIVQQVGGPGKATVYRLIP
ncbi:ATP-binding protein [Nocardia alni]|uniref:ATP-binding protein n=1 Tax=Nocardia alni TaxID=2815723 RepID=UPI001C22868F|nr:ATP-binding protein [Nocardia alni]